METENFYAVIGTRIRKFRKAHNLDQQGLADKLSLPRTSIVNIEKGKQKVTVFQLYYLCKIFQVDFSHLVPFFEFENDNIKWEKMVDTVINTNSIFSEENDTYKASIINFITTE